MGVETTSKINQLLSSQPAGVVLQSNWLAANGYSHSLQQRYRDSRWLESIGQGAMIRAGDRVGYEGAVYALQEQTGFSIHPGGKTALAYLGKAHYLEMKVKNVSLFGSLGERLPVWFANYGWGVDISYHQTSFLPVGVGLTSNEVRNFSIRISGAVRAIMECIYLARTSPDLVECYEFMEGLNNVRPDHVQTLLEQCQSVKVKRLFLYLAEKAEHSWLRTVDLSQIDLGKGKRSLVKRGVFIDKYQITVPKDLENRD